MLGVGWMQKFMQGFIFKSAYALLIFLAHLQKRFVQFRESSTQHQNFGIEMSQVA